MGDGWSDTVAPYAVVMQEFCSKIKEKGVNVMIQQVADCLKQARVPFPAAFRGIMLDNSTKWRGER